MAGLRFHGLRHTAFLFGRLLPILLFSPILRAADTPLYPFLRDGKWGYINEDGSWIIEPRFDRCTEIFEDQRVRVWEKSRWGYIDRTGEWIVKPIFTEPCFSFENENYEVVSIGKKRGVLGISNQLLLPVEYDEIVLAGDRCWVRSGETLGLYNLNGHWLVEPSIPWPRKRAMPIPTASDVAWFQRGKKWGLLSRDGKILFAPQFEEHVIGRKEAEDWNHPEGLDFQDGRAWVKDGANYLMISSEGKVLTKGSFKSVQPWSDHFYRFEDQAENWGLISRDGVVALPAQFNRIDDLADDMAVVLTRRMFKKPNGEEDTDWSQGYINRNGQAVIKPGAYGMYLSPFSDGLAPVRASPPGDRWDPYAGYIERNGRMVIPLKYLDTHSFFEGLGAFKEAVRRPGLSPDAGGWGYLDRTGKVVIAAQFGMTSPFYRGRAWVLRKGGQWDEPQWAMIDRKGKVLTDFAYYPPERFDSYDNRQNERFATSRVRGNLLVLKKGDFLTGLASADGTVLISPIFNNIRDFHDGVAVAVDSRSYPKFITALISECGEILANNIYTEISDFDGGVGWASHRWTDHRGPIQNPGWALIDTSVRELAAPKYLRPYWITGKELTYSDNGCPMFCGNLAPVALADGYQPYGEKVWLSNSWGYMNRAGKIVAWHETMPSTGTKK